MRPLVEAGRVYAAMPPLHRIEVINAGAKKNEYIYTYNELEMRRTVARLEKGGKKVKQPMQRYKGLGEMNADQRWPTRRWTRVIARSVGSPCVTSRLPSGTFELLMGNEVAPGRLHHRVCRRDRPGAHRRLRLPGPGSCSSPSAAELSTGWRTARGVTSAVPTMTVHGSEPNDAERRRIGRVRQAGRPGGPGPG